ncbi:MAG: TonB-dependent receptor, partial [Candidatus Sulfotelmatobacter sp.]
MRKLISFTFALVLTLGVLLVNRAVFAQGVGTSGSLSGTVTDPTGGVVPNTSVTAEDPTRGIHFTVVTDSSGQYRFTNLPPGTYNATVQKAGFQSQIQKGVAVNVGEITIADFRLSLVAAATQVVVNAEPAVIETQRGSQANTLTENYIENLPIDRRDYLTFTLLLPGVSDSTRIADDQDFRVKQTPQSGLSFYGSNGRGNSVTVDGGEVQDDAGGVRPTVSQDAVQEFQVNRSNYTTQLGGASGATINIVTKSGSNEVHGSLFSFFRNDGLDARDPFAFSQALAPGQVFNPLEPDLNGQPVKNSLQRYQFGGNVGLPIKKDKTFLFVAFEGLRQDAENAVPLLTSTSIFRPTASQQAGIQAVANEGNTIVPCLSGPVGAAVAQQLGLPAPNPTTNVPGSTCAAILTGALTVNPATSPSNAFLVNQFEDNGGLFPYTSRDYLASVRLDHHISESDQLSFIYHYAHDLEENPDVQSLTGYSAGSSIHTYDNTIQGAWFHEFSPRTLNELRVQWDYNGFSVIPNEPGEVGLQISGYANNLGTNIFLPNLTILRRTEIADNFTMIRGNHTMKFGVDELLRGNHTESHTFLPGRFVFGALPGDLLTPLLPSLSSMQSASFGLPQVYQQGFGNPDYPAYTRPLTGLYWEDSWKLASNFTLNFGVRY